VAVVIVVANVLQFYTVQLHRHGWHYVRCLLCWWLHCASTQCWSTCSLWPQLP